MFPDQRVDVLHDMRDFSLWVIKTGSQLPFSCSVVWAYTRYIYIYIYIYCVVYASCIFECLVCVVAATFRVSFQTNKMTCRLGWEGMIPSCWEV